MIGSRLWCASPPRPGVSRDLRIWDNHAMTDALLVTIKWQPEPPGNQKRWEHEIRSALPTPLVAIEVEMVQMGTFWRVQKAHRHDPPIATDVRETLTED